VHIDRSVRIERPEKIYLDNYCTLYHGATLVGESRTSTGIFLGVGSTVREYAYLNSYSGFITTGPNVYIGQGSVICGHGGIEIGANTMISQLCSITASTHIFQDIEVPLRFQGETSRGIRIGADVWIAARVSIADGVTIGDNAVIGTGSVVARDVPAWAVTSGNPARILFDRREAKRHHAPL
jgi:acetyltransferase-like isoleucine patch superfamily enzyme